MSNRKSSTKKKRSSTTSRGKKPMRKRSKTTLSRMSRPQIKKTTSGPNIRCRTDSKGRKVYYDYDNHKIISKEKALEIRQNYRCTSTSGRKVSQRASQKMARFRCVINSNGDKMYYLDGKHISNEKAEKIKIRTRCVPNVKGVDLPVTCTERDGRIYYFIKGVRIPDKRGKDSGCIPGEGAKIPSLSGTEGSEEIIVEDQYDIPYNFATPTGAPKKSTLLANALLRRSSSQAAPVFPKKTLPVAPGRKSLPQVPLFPKKSMPVPPSKRPYGKSLPSIPIVTIEDTVKILNDATKNLNDKQRSQIISSKRKELQSLENLIKIQQKQLLEYKDKIEQQMNVQPSEQLNQVTQQIRSVSLKIVKESEASSTSVSDIKNDIQTLSDNLNELKESSQKMENADTAKENLDNANTLLENAKQTIDQAPKTPDVKVLENKIENAQQKIAELSSQIEDKGSATSTIVVATAAIQEDAKKVEQQVDSVIMESSPTSKVEVTVNSLEAKVNSVENQVEKQVDYYDITQKNRDILNRVANCVGGITGNECDSDKYYRVGKGCLPLTEYDTNDGSIEGMIFVSKAPDNTIKSMRFFAGTNSELKDLCQELTKVSNFKTNECKLFGSYYVDLFCVDLFFTNDDEPFHRQRVPLHKVPEILGDKDACKNYIISRSSAGVVERIKILIDNYRQLRYDLDVVGVMVDLDEAQRELFKTNNPKTFADYEQRYEELVKEFGDDIATAIDEKAENENLNDTNPFNHKTIIELNNMDDGRVQIVNFEKF